MTLPGEELSGRYRILSAIGAGGMGEVFLAEDNSLDRKVAIKTLGAEFANDRERLARFVREAKAASALNHPNILTIYEISAEGGANYIVSEYVEGETLKRKIRRERLPLSEILDIAIQTASALAAAHDAGIVHRDVKPENVMVREDGIVKVVDFGIAKLIQPTSESEVHGEAPTLAKIDTEPGMMIGTPQYMSPEQARGQEIDQRSDVFSFGIMLYEMICGKRPFTGDDPMEIISSILKDEAEAVSDLNPDVPDQLERSIEKALRKDKTHRYQNIRDLLIDLEDVRDDVKAEKRTGQSTRAARIHLTDADDAASTGTFTEGIVKTRRFTILHALGFAAVAVLALGVYWWIDSYRHSGPLASLEFESEEVASWNAAPGELFSSASFSPDGKLIAFTSTRTGSKNIWVTQTGSREPIQITRDEFSNQYPVWSPKGDEIAYFSARGNEPGKGGNTTGVWRVSALGGTPVSVGSIADGSSILRRWTKSGKIYYESGGNLHSIDVASGSVQKHTDLPEVEGAATQINVDPDETDVIFAREAEDGWGIFKAPIGSNNFRQVAFHKERITAIAYHRPDGIIYFTADDNGENRLYAVADSGGEPQMIRDAGDDVSISDISPDGNILFSSAREESNIWRVEVESGAESPVARDLESELWPSVSPDGKRLAFQSVRGLNRGNRLFEGQIKVADIGTTNEPAVLTENGFLPAWSPDGSRILFFRYVEDKIRLFVIDSNGGRETEVASDGIAPPGYSVSPYNRVQTSVADWAPDSKRISYFGNTTWGQSLFVVDISGEARDPVEVIPVDSDKVAYSPIWSPDGKRIAFYVQEKKPSEGSSISREIRIASPEWTGSSRQLLSYRSTELFRLLGWNEAGDAAIIATSKTFRSLPPEVLIYEVGGWTREKSKLENAYFYNLFLSPDRQSLAYAARNDGFDDIWVIPAAGGTARKITSNNDSGINFSSLSWSPDGSSIYFGKQSRFSLLSLLRRREKNETTQD